MAMARDVAKLDCEGKILEGIDIVLRTRLDEMSDLREAALHWENIEGVHDMRVTSRRLRSAIKDFEAFLGVKIVPQRRLKKVARALGKVRDQDVAIAALERVRAKGGEEVAAGIEQLLNERKEIRERAREQLESIIAETSLAQLREKFLSRLETSGSAVGKKAGKRDRHGAKVGNFQQAGVEILTLRIVELQDLSDSLHHPFDLEPLHRMRIAAKRLRYAMELFAPCWGGKLFSCSREVAEMQTFLGELRDCDIWITNLGARLDHHRAVSASDGPTANSRAQVRQAAIWLLRYFTKERDKNYRRALARWQKWEMTGFVEHLASLLLGEIWMSTTDSSVVSNMEEAESGTSA